MENKNIGEIRSEASEQITTFLYGLGNISEQYIDYTEINNFFRRLDKLLDYIDNIFNDSTINVQEILGGELEKKSLFSRKENIPLFLYLDLYEAASKSLIDKVAKNHSAYSKLQKVYDDISKKINLLRQEAIKLNFNKKFDPNKHFDEKVGDFLNKSRGQYEIDWIDYEGKKYPILTGSFVAYDLSRNGERSSHAINSQKNYLYVEDKNFISNAQEFKQQEKMRRITTEYMDEVKEFFKNGKLPERMEEFHYMLTEEANNNSDVRVALYASMELFLSGNYLTKEFEIAFQKVKNYKARRKKKNTEKVIDTHDVSNGTGNSNETDKSSTEYEVIESKKAPAKSKEAPVKKSFTKFLEGIKETLFWEKSQTPQTPQTSEKAVEEFDEVRKVEHMIFTKEVINGKEVWVQEDPNAVKVVRK